jgi:hypothetical protein
VVISTAVGTYDYPDTLAVWLPEAAAADPDGLPRVGELVLFTPDASDPSHLLEIRVPGDATVAPAADNPSAWRSLAASIRNDTDAERITLSDRLRTADAGAGSMRACLRFSRLMTPTEADWEDYRDGLLGWTELEWPLDAFSSQAGTRRVVCQTEIQLLRGSEDDAVTAVPLFGSAGVTYELSR